MPAFTVKYSTVVDADSPDDVAEQFREYLACTSTVEIEAVDEVGRTHVLNVRL